MDVIDLEVKTMVFVSDSLTTYLTFLGYGISSGTRSCHEMGFQTPITLNSSMVKWIDCMMDCYTCIGSYCKFNRIAYRCVAEIDVRGLWTDDVSINRRKYCCYEGRWLHSYVIDIQKPPHLQTDMRDKYRF